MDDAEIHEMFSALGPVAIRRMFGGKGIYHAGLIIAVELRGELRLKANDRTAPAFEAAGATRWTYEGKAERPSPCRTGRCRTRRSTIRKRWNVG